MLRVMRPGLCFLAAFLLCSAASAQSEPPPPSPPSPPPPGDTADPTAPAQPPPDPQPGQPPDVNYPGQPSPQQGYPQQGYPQQGYPQQGYYPQQAYPQPPQGPPLPPAEVDDPETHRHDGFYLRLSLGFGGQWTRAEYDDDAISGTLRLSGPAIAYSAMVGGSLWDWAAIGLYLGAVESNQNQADDPEAELEEAGVSRGLVGPFIDIFPNPRKNLHFGLAAGLAQVTIHSARVLEPVLSQAGGVGAAVWGGYGFWVSKNWSLGGMLEASLVNGASRENALKANTFAITGTFSALYH